MPDTQTAPCQNRAEILHERRATRNNQPASMQTDLDAREKMPLRCHRQIEVSRSASGIDRNRKSAVERSPNQPLGPVVGQIIGQEYSWPITGTFAFFHGFVSPLFVEQAARNRCDAHE